jgi:hypothetical protein
VDVAAGLMRRSAHKCKQLVDWSRLEDMALTPDWLIVSYELFSQVCSSAGISDEELCALVPKLDVHPARVVQEAACPFYEGLRREVSLWERSQMGQQNVLLARRNAEIARL